MLLKSLKTDGGAGSQRLLLNHMGIKTHSLVTGTCKRLSSWNWCWIYGSM